MTTVSNLLDPLQRKDRYSFNREESKVFFLTYENENWSSYYSNLITENYLDMFFYNHYLM